MTAGIESLEQERLALQATLDAQKTPAERNQLGQFATPTHLAQEVVTYSIALLPAAASVRFLDPGFGTGSFFSALLSVAKRVEAARGIELDRHYSVPTGRLWKDSGLELIQGDFTRLTPPTSEAERATLLVCNPPYVRHHHLARADKLRLQELSKRACGIGIDGLAGLYCYFMALSHPWMAAGAVAAWLVPSEFMDVNYGTALKRYLLTKVTLVRIHRFDPSDVQFDDALVSSCVVWLRNDPPPPDHSVEFTFGGSTSLPMVTARISTRDLGRERKWTRFPLNGVRREERSLSIGDLFSIKRGIATGANQFFVVEESRAKQLGLPSEVLRPILPSPRFLPDDEIPADHSGLPLIAPRFFLVDCRMPPEEVKAKFPSLWAYLSSGVPEVSERYLCKHRNPWYAQENRQPSMFLCTYIGRRGTRRGRPFRFILNQSLATVPNVYLVMYPKPILASSLRGNPEAARRVWEELRSVDVELLLGEGRVYGGGMHKMEPGELAQVPIPRLAQVVPDLAELPTQLELPS